MVSIPCSSGLGFRRRRMRFGTASGYNVSQSLVHQGLVSDASPTPQFLASPRRCSSQSLVHQGLVSDCVSDSSCPQGWGHESLNPLFIRAWFQTSSTCCTEGWSRRWRSQSLVHQGLVSDAIGNGRFMLVTADQSQSLVHQGLVSDAAAGALDQGGIVPPVSIPCSSGLGFRLHWNPKS